MSIDRSGFKDISDAALKRGEAANAKATKAIEAHGDATKGDTIDDVLTPAAEDHLVAAVYTKFRAHIKENHPGWSVVRRVANEEEREEYKIKKKSKVYFISLKYTGGGASKKRKAKEASADDE